MANAGFCPRADVDPSPLSDIGAAPYTSASSLRAAQISANGVFHDRITYPNVKVGASEMRDGNSNTLLFTENLMASLWSSVGSPNVMDGAVAIPPTYSALAMPNLGNNRFGATFVWCYASEAGVSVDATPVFGAPEVPPQAIMKINGELVSSPIGVGPPHANGARPSSYHPNGVNVAFADGSASFIGNTLPYYVYQQLMTPHGTQSFSPTRINYVLKDEDYQ